MEISILICRFEHNPGQLELVQFSIEGLNEAFEQILEVGVGVDIFQFDVLQESVRQLLPQSNAMPTNQHLLLAAVHSERVDQLKVLREFLLVEIKYTDLHFV